MPSQPKDITVPSAARCHECCAEVTSVFEAHCSLHPHRSALRKFEDEYRESFTASLVSALDPKSQSARAKYRLLRVLQEHGTATFQHETISFLRAVEKEVSGSRTELRGPSCLWYWGEMGGLRPVCSVMSCRDMTGPLFRGRYSPCPQSHPPLLRRCLHTTIGLPVVHPPRHPTPLQSRGLSRSCAEWY